MLNNIRTMTRQKSSIKIVQPEAAIVVVVEVVESVVLIAVTVEITVEIVADAVIIEVITAVDAAIIVEITVVHAAIEDREQCEVVAVAAIMVTTTRMKISQMDNMKYAGGEVAVVNAVTEVAEAGKAA